MQDHYTPDDKSSCSIPSVPGIYKITCVTTGRFYVGSAIDLRNRWSTHLYRLRRNIHHNAKMQASWNKYGGKQAFVFEILECVMFPEMLINREQYYIDTLSPFGKKGFNLAPVAGSRLGHKQSPEAIEKMRQANLGRKQSSEAIEKTRQSHLGRKRSLETCKRISVAKTGKSNRNLGRKHTPEEIERHRLRMTGFKHTEESKRNMGKAQIGRVHSIESREKRRQSLMGHAVSPETGAKIAEANKGRKASKETRAKQSAAQKTRQRTPEEYVSRRKTLILTDPNGIEYTVTGIHDFCKEHGLDGSAINKVVKGRYAHHRGWTARYPDANIG